MSCDLNDSQVRILQHLARLPVGESLSTDNLAKRVGVGVSSGNLGPVFEEVLHNYPDSLYGMGLVKPLRYEGEPTTWAITSAGRKLAEKVKARVRLPGERVPPALLDPILKKLKASRTYGLESFTETDFKEIREALGEDWKDLPSATLAQQINNRRKQGAFVDPEDKVRRRVKQAIKDFGPGGAIEEVFTESQVEKLQALMG